MALNEKYTWADFLREHPGKKDVKRTSPEGKKAFEQAYKAFVKKYLTTQLERLERQQQRATEVRNDLVTRLKATEKHVIAKRLQARVGQKDHAVAIIAKQIDRARDLQKQF